MKLLWVGINLVYVAILLNGCLYRNECGYSHFYWEEKSYYYDSQGNYRETCPDNVIYREDAPRNHDSLMDLDAPIY